LDGFLGVAVVRSRNNLLVRAPVHGSNYVLWGSVEFEQGPSKSTTLVALWILFLGNTAQYCEVFLSARETFSKPINDLVELTCLLEVMKNTGYGASPAHYRKVIV
jgi:hypothetical protein